MAQYSICKYCGMEVGYLMVHKCSDGEIHYVDRLVLNKETCGGNVQDIDEAETEQDIDK